jgi:hypothetical protein
MIYVALRIVHVEARDKNALMTPKNSAAVELGRRGGEARARKLTPEERREAARKAVEARWAKHRKLAAEISEGTSNLLRIAKANDRKAAKARSD